MRSCKPYFKNFLTALMEDGKAQEAEKVKECRLQMNMLRQAPTVSEFNKTMSITPEFNVRFSTITNCMEVPRANKTILFATVHHLYAIDENQELFPLVFGGKYRFVYDWEKERAEEAAFALEYLSGNTYLTHGVWLPPEQRKRGINGKELRQEVYPAASVEDVVYRFFWAVDTMDEKLFAENAVSDIQITRAGADGGSYDMNGIAEAAAFLAKDKQYYSQNQYSVHIERTEFEDETHALIHALHLYPADTGNKHRGSQNKYSQFYNELLTLTLEKQDRWRIKNVMIKRKENPIPYGYQILEL